MPKSLRHTVHWDSQASRYRVVKQGGGKTTSPRLDFQGQPWQEWLEQVPSFAFVGKGGHHLTARKEMRARGNTYWIAYRKVSGKLIHKYLGRPVDVTLSRLEEVAAALAGQEIQAALSEPTDGQRESSMQELLADQLLSTKFFIPVSSHMLVPRPRLFGLLDEGLLRSLMVVSAPAGFGKTTLLSFLVFSRDVSHQPAGLLLAAARGDATGRPCARRAIEPPGQTSRFPGTRNGGERAGATQAGPGQTAGSAHPPGPDA